MLAPKKYTENNLEYQESPSEEGLGVQSDGGSIGDGEAKNKVPDKSGGVVKERDRSSANAEEVGGRKKEKSIVPSASSIVLELLERTQNRRISESQMLVSPGAPPAHHSNPITAANKQICHNNNMSNGNPNGATGGDNGGASTNTGYQTQHQSQASAPSNSQQGHKSVVPQLMDIYDDLTQSSTPQTVPHNANAGPMPALPHNAQQAPMPKGVYYTGSQSFGTTSSRNSERTTKRRSNSRSQYPGGGVVSATLSSVAAARSLRSAGKRPKTNEVEECLPRQATRKKGKSSAADQRWSKRFTWPDEVSVVCIM